MEKVKHFLVIDDDPVSRFIAGDAIEEAALAETLSTAPMAMKP